MSWIRNLTAVCLSLTLGGSSLAYAGAASTIDANVLDEAVAARADDDARARERVRALLERDDVRRLVGLDALQLQRAQAAVAVLDGDELRAVNEAAAGVETALTGGAYYIQISLVAALLIIIIVILLAD